MFFPPELFAPIHEIRPYLFLGDATSVQSTVLSERGICFIVNAASDDDTTAIPHCEYLNIPAQDNCYDLSQHFASVVSFIERARSVGSAVLVHCVGGVSRSATLVIAYLMWADYSLIGSQSTMNRSLDEVQRIRCQVCPNHHFINQLLKWQELLHSDYQNSLLSAQSSHQSPSSPSLSSSIIKNAPSSYVYYVLFGNVVFQTK
eukprot:TRINITY_DN12415_c0_g1_i1.p1 TRINITY_DN12415_c0_g1~~TRINITY_DN12415_c0_g1_i1.p1  ORF type:complete len:203 (-),score=33.70 TRINITY_DN12415_c0_g1_i1:79-687(-)